jgi:hypothetical protein
VDACTVTASDVTAAFAASDPNLLLAKPVGFFGSERPVNHFTGAITQSTSDWQRLIDANPFDRRRKPHIGYAPATYSCERVDNPDACTVSACYVTTAFAVSGPGLPLAERPVFSGRSIRRIASPVRSLSLLRISCCLFQLSFQLSTRVILIHKREMSTPRSCAKTQLFSAFIVRVKAAKHAGAPMGDIARPRYPQRLPQLKRAETELHRCAPHQNDLLTGNSGSFIVCLRVFCLLSVCGTANREPISIQEAQCQV